MATTDAGSGGVDSATPPSPSPTAVESRWTLPDMCVIAAVVAASMLWNHRHGLTVCVLAPRTPRPRDSGSCFGA